jgi:hypothetical protein
VKAHEWDVIRTLVPVESDFEDRTYDPGIIGDVVEAYADPERYAVDLAIPDDSLVGGYRYDNVVLLPDQFVVVQRHAEQPSPAHAG